MFRQNRGVNQKRKMWISGGKIKLIRRDHGLMTYPDNCSPGLQSTVQSGVGRIKASKTDVWEENEQVQKESTYLILRSWIIKMQKKKSSNTRSGDGEGETIKNPKENTRLRERDV